MADIITQMGLVFSALMEQIPNIADAITGNDILMLGISIFFSGAVIGFFVRLLRST